MVQSTKQKQVVQAAGSFDGCHLGTGRDRLGMAQGIVAVAGAAEGSLAVAMDIAA